MELILSFIIEVFFEFVLSAILELLVEVGVRSVGQPFVASESRNPILAAFGYFLLGLILGGLSLLVFPDPFVRSDRFHGISLLLSPVLAGLLMALIGQLRKKQGKTLLRLDSFAYGFLFAFPFALIRFLYTT